MDSSKVEGVIESEGKGLGLNICGTWRRECGRVGCKLVFVNVAKFRGLSDDINAQMIVRTTITTYLPESWSAAGLCGVGDCSP